MVKKTKADLERENKRLKRKNSDLENTLNSLSSLAVGLTIYGIVATAVLAVAILL